MKNRSLVNRSTTDLQTLQQRAFLSRRNATIETLESRRLLAAAGDLDPTFSGDGKVIDQFTPPLIASHTVVQADGKVIIVGEPQGSDSVNPKPARFVRYTTAGAIDSTFGTGGTVTVNLPGANHTYVQAMAVQGDGKIVVAGIHRGTVHPTDDAFVMRLLPGGGFDTSFGGGDGVVVYDFGTTGNTSANGVALQSDGKIVVGGTTTGTTEDLSVARFTTSGAFDTSFSGDGKATIDFGSRADLFGDLAVGPDGKIVLVGNAVGYRNELIVARLTTAGSLDTFLSGDGRGNYPHMLEPSVAVLPNNRILIAGHTHDGQIALQRLAADGGFDRAWSATDGRIVLGDPQQHERPTNLFLRPDGRFIITSPNPGGGFMAARFLASGGFDTSFGSAGVARHHIYGDDAQPARSAIAPDGKIVMTGYGTNDQGTDNRTLVARFLVEPTTTTPPDNIFKDSAGVVHGVGTAGNDTLRADFVTSPDEVIVTVNGASEAFTGVSGVRLDGLAGNDQLDEVSSGQDRPPITLVGGDGNDTFETFRSETTVLGGAGDDTVDLDFSAVGVPNLFDGGSGIDSIHLHLQNDIDLNDHPGVENASAEDGNLIGNALDNRLFLSEGGNLTGNGGNDTLSIGSFGGTLDGGAGNDVLTVSDANDGHSTPTTLIGGAGNDSITGGLNDDSITGGDGNDTLRGGAAGFAGGNDSINAGIGDDWIYVRDPDHDDSPDTVDGGAGFDRAERDPTDTVTNVEEFLNEGSGTGPVYIDGRNLFADGTAGNDTITASFEPTDDFGGSVIVRVNGVGGQFSYFDFDSILLRGYAGDDLFQTDVFGGYIDIEMGSGNDSASFNKAGATVVGGDGNDSVNYNDSGDANIDFFDGGAGRDLLFARRGTIDLRTMPTVEDAQVAENGTIHGNGLNNTLTLDRFGVARGYDGNDTIFGGSGNNALFGGNGNDRIRGGGGNDYIEGNAGNDTMYGDAGADQILGHAGSDYFWIRDGERDTVDGGAGDYDRAQIDSIDSTTGMEAFIP